MDPETAKAVVIAIAAVGAVTWLAGLTVLLRATRERQARAQEAAERFDVEHEAAPGMIFEEAEVDGRPEELSSKLAGLLARDGMGPLGPLKIAGCDRHEVAFEAAGPTFSSTGYGTPGFRRGWVRFAPSGSRTRIDYAVEAPSGRVLLGIGWLVLILGLVALVVGLWLEFTYVLPSPNPSIRTQAVQMVQVVHFLWPPFLFAYLARQPSMMLRSRLESLVHNLPYV
jgi:hypothetical protein